MYINVYIYIYMYDTHKVRPPVMFVGGQQICKYPEPPFYDGLNHHFYQYLDGLESRYIYICIYII